MNIKKITALLCAVVMVLSLAACGSGSGDKAENKHYTVGICQLVQHDALDAATKGFRDAITDALGAENVTFDEQNAAGDSATCATICNGFVSSGVDLIPCQRDRRAAGCGRRHEGHSDPRHGRHGVRRCARHRQLLRHGRR